MEIIRQKNAATYVVFPLTDVTGTAVASASSLDSEIDNWNDGGIPDGLADCSNEATPIGSGLYYLSLTQAEMNYDYIVVTIKSSDAVQQNILIRTVAHDPALALATSGNVGDTQTYLSGLIAPVQVDLDNPAQYKADVSALALEATVGALNNLSDAEVWAYGTRALSTPADYKADVTELANISGYIQPMAVEVTQASGAVAVFDNYKADVSELANISGYIQPAAVEITQMSGAIASPNDFKADVTELANISGYIVDTEGTLSGYIAEGGAGGASAEDVWTYAGSRALTTPDDYKANVTGINTIITNLATAQADLDNPDQYKADVSSLSGYVADVGQDVSSIKTKTDNLPADTSGVLELIKGLVGQNIYATFTWDGNDDNTKSAIQVYDTAANASTHDGVNGLIASYSATGTYTDNQLQTFKMVKD